MTVPQAEWKIRSTTHAVFLEAQRKSKDLGLPFTLKLADIVIPAKCPIFGTALEYSKPKRCPHTPVLIMLDPASGFVPRNVRIVSYRAAELRGEVAPAELRTIADYLCQQGVPEHGR